MVCSLAGGRVPRSPISPRHSRWSQSHMGTTVGPHPHAGRRAGPASQPARVCWSAATPPVMWAHESDEIGDSRPKRPKARSTPVGVREMGDGERRGRGKSFGPLSCSNSLGVNDERRRMRVRASSWRWLCSIGLATPFDSYSPTTLANIPPRLHWHSATALSHLSSVSLC